MTGYVLVPPPQVLEPASLAAWLQRALEFTLTLPKKPAKRARGAGKTDTPKRKR
jgi:hypothetical protein